MDEMQWLHYLHDRFSASDGNLYTMYLSIYGYRVRVLCSGIRPPELMKLNLSFFLAEEDSAPDETVYIWQDDLADLVSGCPFIQDEVMFRYYRRGNWSVRMPDWTRRLCARYAASKTTFLCFEDKEFPFFYYNKPFVNEIQWWLEDSFFVLHGAGIGTGGHGALIISPSGAGKSTLALAGLSAGMGFIADDYILINREGPVKAWPLFRTGYLSPASLDMLPCFREQILMYVKHRNKYLIDLTEYGQQFCMALPMEMVIYPVISVEKEPQIRRSTSARNYVNAVTSTVKQIRRHENIKDSFAELFPRLSGLPSYELSMSADAVRNALKLKSFLISLSSVAE